MACLLIISIYEKRLCQMRAKYDSPGKTIINPARVSQRYQTNSNPLKPTQSLKGIKLPKKRELGVLKENSQILDIRLNL